MHDDRQFCTFVVDGLYLGIAVRHVQEVMRAIEMTTVPLAPGSVNGLINLRGQIITAIDLRQRLGLSPRVDTEPPMLVVVNTDEGPVSFLVDEIGDVIETEPSSFEPTPPMLPPEARALVTGVHKLENRLLLILDTARASQLDSVAV